MRAVTVREEKKKEFREYLNIENEELLEALLDLAVEPETLVAFTLVPLVEVAWADGEIQPKERDAIIKAAIERGVSRKTARPPLCSGTGWQHAPILSCSRPGGATSKNSRVPSATNTWAEMKKTVMGRARAIAEAAGGFLGVASISAAEKKMLEELEWAFE